MDRYNRPGLDIMALTTALFMLMVVVYISVFSVLRASSHLGFLVWTNI
jgi:hypothetical protein